MPTLNDIANRAHETAVAKGFYDPPPEVTERLCLIHSEVSEALEAWRDDDMGTRIREDGKPEGFASELADIIIRVCDLAKSRNIDLDTIVTMKMAYNDTRPRKHGRVR